MEKDINVLLGTTNDDIFEEQAMNWPGVEVWRNLVWKCTCGDPDCFRVCMQNTGNRFGVERFATLLDSIIGVEDLKSLMDIANSLVAENGVKVMLSSEYMAMKGADNDYVPPSTYKKTVH
jgi:hypothetical protein